MKQKNFEIVTDLIEELGLPFDELVNYWEKISKIHQRNSRDVDREGIKLIPLRMPRHVAPGMFVYEDGLIYPEIIDGYQIKAIVCGLIDGKVLAICLQEKVLPWSSDFLDVSDILKTLNGVEATRSILIASQMNNRKAEAAEWCWNFCENGVRQGEAFLPSNRELKCLRHNKEIVNLSLSKLKLPLLSENWYWSSTVFSHFAAWHLNMSSGAACTSNQVDSLKEVRPMVYCII